MGDVVDIKTRRVIQASACVKTQQKVYQREEIQKALADVMKTLEEQGYRFDKSILIMPHDEKNPASIGISKNMGIEDMVKIVKPAYVNLVKSAKLEAGED